jgi:putative nucleotidyltransferase with HDIG domain
MKTILFVDDEFSILEGLKRMLRPMRSEWEMHFATSGAAALSIMESTNCDVIVSDMRMPEMDGATLLELVREQYPSAVRIILSGYTELQASLRAVSVAHQFLLKPCDVESLRAAVARSTSLGRVLDSRMLTSIVGSLREIPPLPRVFTELKLALANPKTTIEQVSKIVEQDVAVSAKLLQLVNSAFFGTFRNVTDIKSAVVHLGMSVLQDLILTLAIFRSFTANEHLSQEYIEEIHRHGRFTARIAAGITQNAQSGAGSVLAALLHDIGKLVIAERLPAHLVRALEQSEEEGRPLYEVEESLIQISHAEVGAYLLSLWGLPASIVEAVAHHHHPRRVAQNGIDTVLIVYVANLLALEREALAKGGRPPEFDMELLEETGAAPRLADWRVIAEAAYSNQPQLVT